MIFSFARERIRKLTDQPEAWGGHEAAEMQVLLLLEACEAEISSPRQPSDRRVVDAYIRFADDLTGAPGIEPLSTRMRKAGREASFPAALARFANQELVYVLARLRRRRPLLFGVDYDGTLAEDPALFGHMVEALHTRDHGVVVVTGRSDEGRWGDEVRSTLAAIGLDIPIVFAANGWKRKAAEKAGYKVDVWIDDHPEWVGPQDPAVLAQRETR